MPAIEVEELTKTYGDRHALEEVSLTVEEGECLALLGPNGAGKSTLVDVLATIRAPTSGHARVLGHDVADQPHAVRRQVGVAFQTPITHDHLTAREIVLHQARLYAMGNDEARSRAEELLAFVGLADRAGDRASTFSEGMKRRLDLARVLVTDPDVLLLDEPAAGLDPRGRRAIREKLRSLADRGTTLLLATHQMRELGSIADRVAILHEGRVRALDPPSALTQRLGDHVLRVRLEPEADPEPVEDQLERLGERLHRHGTILEAALAAAGPSPGSLVDELEAASGGIAEVSVHAPDLGDVFLDVTGRPLEDDEDEIEHEEVAA